MSVSLTPSATSINDDLVNVERMEDTIPSLSRKIQKIWESKNPAISDLFILFNEMKLKDPNFVMNDMIIICTQKHPSLNELFNGLTVAWDKITVLIAIISIPLEYRPLFISKAINLCKNFNPEEQKTIKVQAIKNFETLFISLLTKYKNNFEPHLKDIFKYLNLQKNLSREDKVKLMSLITHLSVESDMIITRFLNSQLKNSQTVINYLLTLKSDCVAQIATFMQRLIKDYKLKNEELLEIINLFTTLDQNRILQLIIFAHSLLDLNIKKEDIVKALTKFTSTNDPELRKLLIRELMNLISSKSENALQTIQQLLQW